MDIIKLQNNLNALGQNITVDGDLGPKTFTAILNATVGRDLGNVGVLLGRELYSDLKKYDIFTPLRIVNFLAQAAHETSAFKYFTELGSGKDANHDGFDDYLQKYDFRKDLGNGHVGDGPKYRGRGIFQLTGYFNYLAYGKRLGIDLAGNPGRAADPDIAVLTACLYWADKGLSAYADQDNYVMITKRINGGQNGLAERKAYHDKLMRIFNGV